MNGKGVWVFVFDVLAFSRARFVRRYGGCKYRRGGKAKLAT